MSALASHPDAVVAVFTGKARIDLDLDCIYATYSDARSHVRDLRKNYGCDDARTMHFVSESAAYEWFEANR